VGTYLLSAIRYQLSAISDEYDNQNGHPDEGGIRKAALIHHYALQIFVGR
jgi:hypothetical protein